MSTHRSRRRIPASNEVSGSVQKRSSRVPRRSTVPLRSLRASTRPGGWPGETSDGRDVDQMRPKVFVMQPIPQGPLDVMKEVADVEVWPNLRRQISLEETIDGAK